MSFESYQRSFSFFSMSSPDPELERLVRICLSRGRWFTGVTMGDWRDMLNASKVRRTAQPLLERLLLYGQETTREMGAEKYLEKLI
jgi:hypothetical protein